MLLSTVHCIINVLVWCNIVKPTQHMIHAPTEIKLSTERLHCDSIVHVKALVAPAQSPSHSVLAPKTNTAQDVPSQITAQCIVKPLKGKSYSNHLNVFWIGMFFISSNRAAEIKSFNKHSMYKHVEQLQYIVGLDSTLDLILIGQVHHPTVSYFCYGQQFWMKSIFKITFSTSAFTSQDSI